MFEDKNELLVVVLGGIFLFVLGLVAGTWLDSPSTTTSSTSQVEEQVEEAVAEGSKVVKFVSKSVSGTVAEVSDPLLVLEEAGDTLSFKVSPDVRIVKVTLPSPTVTVTPPAEPKREEIRLDQIKVGDKVDALLSSQPDGSFLATEVTVLVESMSQ